jgi:4'-phosphopantetheinyl transferase
VTSRGLAHPSTAPWLPTAAWRGAQRGAVDVWRIALDAVPARDEVLSAGERERAARLRIESKRRQYRVARSALRVLLGRYLDRDPACLELRFGDNGKPELPASGFSFNLSHSGELALLAVTRADVRLGIDVEQMVVERAHDRLARRFFSTEEADRYAALAAPERAAAFYRLWTRKEAYLKAWGTGLSFSSRRFTLELEPGSGPLLLRTEMPGDETPRGWWFEALEPGAGYVATACWQGERAPLRAFQFE